MVRLARILADRHSLRGRSVLLGEVRNFDADEKIWFIRDRRERKEGQRIR
jgi:hypothetical protein